MLTQVYQLPGGLRVAVEPVPHARSVSIGVWLGAGSHYEVPREAGAAHFLEHMLFKGTRHRSGRELANFMDRIGGEFNATTSREATCFYGWVLTDYWREALLVLAEILLESRMDAGDVERERNVILEEIRGDEDSAEIQAMNAFDRLLWGRHPLGRPVAGTVRSVTGLTRDDLWRLFTDLYTPDNAVIAIAGGVDPGLAIATVADAFAPWQGQRGRRLPAPPRPPRPARLMRRRRADQVHLCLGGAGPALSDPDLYTATLLSTLLGGGASSRLFQRIREEESLAYTVYAFHEAFRMGGTLGVYAAVHPAQARRAVTLIREELQRLIAVSPPQEELDRARVQVRSGLLLTLESVPERANRAGEALVVLDRLVPVDETLARLQRVTPEDVRALACRLWGEGVPIELAYGPVADGVLTD